MFTYMVLALAIVPAAVALGNGAPVSACITLIPGHVSGGTPIVGQTSAHPYNINVASATVKQGGKVRVTLQTTDSSSFGGFVLQARCSTCATADTKVIGGTFTPTDTAVVKTINCDGGSANTVTHTDTSAKTKLEFDFAPPQNAAVDDAYVFRATVAKDHDNWWSGVKSAELKITAGAAIPATAIATVLLAAIGSMLL